MMNKEKAKKQRSDRRSARVRAKIFGTAARPRLRVSRSNKGMYAQLIDDEKSLTLASSHTREVKNLEEKGGDDKKGKKEAASYGMGKSLAKKALEKKIESAVFDRGGYKYHGRIKAAAEGARDGGLKF
jgi:large subunit ribosomal protein L18